MYKQRMKPGIATAVLKALQITVLTCIFSWGAAYSYAASQSQLSALNSQITNLQQSIRQDEDAITKLERTLWGLDAKILDAQKQIRKERDELRAAYHDIKRDAKKQLFDIEGIKKAIELIDQDIELVQRDSQRSQEYFNSLNPLKRQFEEASHSEKLQENQAKVEQLLTEKQTLIESLTAAETKHKLLKEKLKIAEGNMEDISLEEDARFADLLVNREQDGQRIIAMRNQVKSDKARLVSLKRKRGVMRQQIAKAKQAEEEATEQSVTQAVSEPESNPAETAATGKKRPAYVFVISGEQEPDIEKSLKLKEWVESYGAQYIQAKWNGFDAAGNNAGTDHFKEQFLSKLQAIENDAKIILIGHGRGGGAAIEAATEVAFNASRTIEFLAVIDPIGDENLRANIVYDTKVKCTKPNPEDEITNTEYVSCLRESKKRLITANVKHFYNRWQKDGKGPEDFYRRIKAINDNGENIVIPTATGRFATAETIQEDQKRVYLGNSEEAHKKLLAEEARNLPRLLVKHLR